MATIDTVIAFTEQALRESATISEAQQRIAREFPDRAIWEVKQVIVAALGGDEMDIQPEPGSLREKFWAELQR